MSFNLSEPHDDYRDADETEVDLSLESAQQLRPNSTPPTTSPVATSKGGRRLSRRGERCGRCFRRLPVRVAFRLANLAFAFIFVASAVIQHNRSVGALWAAIYLAEVRRVTAYHVGPHVWRPFEVIVASSIYAAAFCVLAELSWLLLRTYVMLPALWLFTMCTLVGAIYILVAKILMSDSSPRDFSEDAYNFWGLSAISFWMSIVLILDRHNVVGIFQGYSSLSVEHERDKEGHVQMGEAFELKATFRSRLRQVDQDGSVRFWQEIDDPANNVNIQMEKLTFSQPTSRHALLAVYDVRERCHDISYLFP